MSQPLRQIIEDCHSQLVNKKTSQRMKNRTCEDVEGLTWSTIAELLGDDKETPQKLRNLILDLTDLLTIKDTELIQLNAQILALQDKISACLGFGVKRLGYPKVIKYLHDREPKTVKVSGLTGEIIIEVEPLTISPDHG